MYLSPDVLQVRALWVQQIPFLRCCWLFFSSICFSCWKLWFSGELSDTVLAPVTFFYGRQRLCAVSWYLLAWYAEGVCSSHICDLSHGEVSGKGAKYPRFFFSWLIFVEEKLRVTNHGQSTFSTLTYFARNKALSSGRSNHWFPFLRCSRHGVSLTFHSFITKFQK